MKLGLFSVPSAPSGPSLNQPARLIACLVGLLLLAAIACLGESLENQQAGDYWPILRVGEASAQPSTSQGDPLSFPYPRGSQGLAAGHSRLCQAQRDPGTLGLTPSPRPTHPSARASVARPWWQAAAVLGADQPSASTLDPPSPEPACLPALCAAHPAPLNLRPPRVSTCWCRGSVPSANWDSHAILVTGPGLEHGLLGASPQS